MLSDADCKYRLFSPVVSMFLCGIDGHSMAEDMDIFVTCSTPMWSQYAEVQNEFLKSNLGIWTMMFLFGKWP